VTPRGGVGESPAVAVLDFERPESLSAIAKRLIRTRIVTGEIGGDRIYSVPILAAALGVSATPVREAMRELALEGLLEVVPNRGFRVADVSKHDLEEIFELRSMLEVPAAGQIARFATRESLEPCLLLATQIEVFARSADVARFLDADREFHKAFLSSLGNRRLVEIVERLRNQVRWRTRPGSTRCCSRPCSGTTPARPSRSCGGTSSTRAASGPGWMRADLSRTGTRPS
jgi:DNA-binding GntR family transcriptional regulator